MTNLENDIQAKFENVSDAQLIKRIEDAPECSVQDCLRKVKGRGLCNMHWFRWRRTGDVGGVAPKRIEHGMSSNELYPIWEAMRDRCNNPRNPGFGNYGGRGISICSRWDDFTLFLSDMGDRPSGTSLERVDGDGHYEPSNCVWASRTTQNINRRVPCGNTSNFRGVVLEKGRWRARIGLNYTSLLIG